MFSKSIRSTITATVINQKHFWSKLFTLVVVPLSVHFDPSSSKFISGLMTPLSRAKPLTPAKLTSLLWFSCSWLKLRTRILQTDFIPWQTRLIAFQFNRLKGLCSLRGNPLSDDALGSLHHVDVVSIANVSEVRSASIFGDEVSKMGELEYCHEFGGLCVPYKTGSGLVVWIYWQLLNTTRNYSNYSNYSALADLHTLQFTGAHALGSSVFTSRILATDLSQSYCNFKSHMKSSFHSLISSLHFFSITLVCHLQNSTQFLTTTNWIELFFNWTLSFSDNN
jgi:hypothetical protein